MTTAPSLRKTMDKELREFVFAAHDASVVLWRRTDLTPEEIAIREKLTKIKNDYLKKIGDQP